MGCAKNTVDGEILSTILDNNGWQVSEYPEKSDIIILNTCGFIKDAKEESIDAILQACQLKEKNDSIKIIVTGCLGQRYSNELKKEIPQIDHIIPIMKNTDIMEIIEGSYNGNLYKKPHSLIFNDDLVMRNFDKSKPYAYLRLSEGCSNYCSYCAIPLIRGEFRSRDPDKIIKEAEYLIKNGIKELILISQDTTSYGRDLKTHVNLSYLLMSLCSIDGDFWIRLLYCHPAHFNNDLIYTVNDEDKILHYIDIPIQHCNDRLLSSMGRGYTKRDIINLITQIRNKIDDAVIRTTLIVGYPGETEEDCEELLEFIEEIEFNHLGAFKYSAEEGTRAYNMKDQIPEKIIERRLERVMLMQADISGEKNSMFVGNTYNTLIEKSNDPEIGKVFARCFAQAPDVDGIIMIDNGKKSVKTDRFYKVKITDADVYDLYGEIQ